MTGMCGEITSTTRGIAYKMSCIPSIVFFPGKIESLSGRLAFRLPLNDSTMNGKAIFVSLIASIHQSKPRPMYASARASF